MKWYVLLTFIMSSYSGEIVLRDEAYQDKAECEMNAAELKVRLQLPSNTIDAWCVRLDQEYKEVWM